MRGGTLRVLLSEDLDAIDPQRAGAPASWSLMRALHRGLMAFPAAAAPAGARPVPDLAAEMPQVSPDGRTYTFQLRDDGAFGRPANRPVEARDVKAGIERITALRPDLVRYFSVISGVAATDPRTVVITLTRPVNDLLSLLALPAASAVPAGLLPSPRPDQISPSGPYRLDEDDGYVPERRIHLVRNEAWEEAGDPVRRAWVDEIVFDIGAAPADIDRRLLDGRADLSGDVGPTTAFGISPDRAFGATNGCLRYLFLNTRSAPFKFASARAAVAAAVDRAAIEALDTGRGVPAATILPPTVEGHDASRSVSTADPAQAKRILAPTDYRDGFATRLIVGDRAIDRAEGLTVRRALARAGIRVTVTPVPISLLYEDRYEVAAAGVPMGIATWCADWPGVGARGALAPLVGATGLAARGATNYAGVNVAVLNTSMDAAALERDPVSAADAWEQADRQATALAAVVPLLHLNERSVLGPRVRGFVPHPYFVRGDLTNVWLESS